MKVNTRVLPALAGSLALVMFISGCSTVPGASALKLKTGRYGPAAVTDGKLIYVIGGSGPDGMLGDIEAIDPWSGRVEVITTNLIPRRYHSAVLRGNLIYIAGGESGPEVQPVIEVFNLKTRTSRVETEMPTPRRFAQAVAVGNNLYVIGGQDANQISKKSERRTGIVEVYDLGRGKWSSAPPMPTPRECTLAAGGGKIFAIGGYSGGETGLRTFETYDVKARKWSRNADLPFPLSSSSALLAEDFIFTFGEFSRLNRVARYSLKDGTWTEIEIPYRKSRHNACVRIGDQVYVIGGNVSAIGSHMDLIQRFSLEDLLNAKERAVTAN